MRAAALVVLVLAAGCSAGGDGVAPTGDATLRVVVEGLPAGMPAAVVVTGPDGFARSLDASTDLDDLVPGDYDVAAHPVLLGSGTAEPLPADQAV
ncbi:MAG TPA: hypothetical protein VFX50_18150, partial [Gemmatimonadales bacterium]|nr:hypothetical protein [Gemmatimonadales bacterium]